MKSIIKIFIFICSLFFCTACARKEETDQVIMEEKKDSAHTEEAKQETMEELSYEEYPNYFRQILLGNTEVEESVKKHIWWYGYEDTDIEDNRVAYNWIRHKDGRVVENIEFDLSEYEVNSNIRSLYYVEGTDTFFHIIYASSPEGTQAYTFWIEFSLDDPENYLIYKFSNEEVSEAAWFGDSYLIGNTFYMGYPDITAIDISTKKAYRCEEELGIAMEYADLLVEEWSFYEFSVATVIDEVIVYRLIVAQGNDIPPFTYVYTAYRENELIGVLVTQSDETSKIIYEEIRK